MSSFLQKSWSEKRVSANFFIRRTLSKLPYVPAQLKLRIGPNEEINFRWSYIVPFYDPGRGFFDYWGQDIGDLRFLWRVLQPGMLFIDVGAYHGVYTMLAAKRLAGQGRVIAFEPSPREQRRIRTHLRWNDLRSIRLEPYAIGAERSEAVLFQVVDGDTSRNGLRAPVSNDGVRAMAVKTLGLDQYIRDAGLDRVDVIKIDVEGGELEALRGATNLLTATRPLFVCEVLDAATKAWGYPAREILLTLQEHDFVCFEFQPDGTLQPHRVKDEYPEVRNYLAVPREKYKSGDEWLKGTHGETRRRYA